MASLDDIYARMPRANCKGLCQAYCGFIACTELEAKRMEEAAGGVKLAVGADGFCVYLKEGRCSVYAERPFVCRLFGAGTNPLMLCPHGCQPDRRVNDTEARAIQRQISKIGGEPVLSALPR